MEWLYKVCCRSGGIVIWYRKDSDIAAGVSSGSKWIQLDEEDFLLALNIARNNLDKWVYVYKKQGKPDIPEHIKVRDV